MKIFEKHENLSDILVVGGLIIVVLLVLQSWTLGPQEERVREQNEERERELQTKKQLENCKSSMASNIERSCRADPEFAYCSLNYDRSEIMGSGCTRMIKNLPLAERADFCIKRSLGTVPRACLAEVYGCTAVTGDINC